MEYKFMVAQRDIPGLPGLSAGDAVLPAGTEIIDHYEYDVWSVIPSRTVAKTRVEHKGDLATVTVDGESMAEISAKVRQVSDGFMHY